MNVFVLPPLGLWLRVVLTVGFNLVVMALLGCILTATLVNPTDDVVLKDHKCRRDSMTFIASPKYIYCYVCDAHCLPQS